MLTRVVGDLPVITAADGAGKPLMTTWKGGGRALLATCTAARQVVHREATWSQADGHVEVFDAAGPAWEGAQRDRAQSLPSDTWAALHGEAAHDVAWLMTTFRTSLQPLLEMDGYVCHRLSDQRWLVVRQGCFPSAECLDHFDLYCSASGEVLVIQRVWFAGRGASRQPARAIFWSGSPD